MDPSSISSASASTPPTNTVPFAAEPNNHPPPPAPAADNPVAHPTYTEMIYTAIGALKEQNGSSKRAIAKYIEQVFKEHLPTNHDSMLAYHIKRLKSDGMLVMDKKSYKLPGSAPLPPPAAAAAGPVVVASPPPQASRPRGRPRKAQPQFQPHPEPQFQPQPEPEEAQFQNPPLQLNNAQQNAEPVWAALGLADEPVAAQAVITEGTKRRPGRPRKSPAVEVAQPGPSSATPRRRGRPPGSVKRQLAEPAAVAADPSLPKRRPGRPPKDQPQATPIPFAALPDPAAAPEVPVEQGVAVALPPRSRGRPRKNAYAVVVAGAVPATGAVVRGRGRGRPRGRGRGRGAGLAVQLIRRPGKRPVGRPRKVIYIFMPVLRKIYELNL